MQNKKKCLTKQTQKQIKRVPLSNIPSFNCTEEIRIPTLSSTELKGIVRSIDMRKLPNSNPYKKNISRKSTCKSVKQNLNYQPPKLKTMMKQFKELKILHQNERSKSKSPVSCKSKSLQKLIPKKLSYKTLRTNPASEVNLAVKLEKTIKKLNQTDFFKEQDSLLPLKSSSELASDRRCIEKLMTEQDQIININEVRQFCSTGTIQRHKDKNLAFKSYTSFKQTMAAVKIQREWRRYQTTKLVNNYVRFLHQQEEHAYLPNLFFQSMKDLEVESYQENQIIDNEEERQQLVVAPESFYKQKAQRSKIRHISNLQDEVQSASQDYEDIVKTLKAEQLQKWNQIISIISASKTDNPQELQKLLQRLAQQSEINKKQLQQKTRVINSISAKKKNLPLKQQQEQKMQLSERGQEQPRVEKKRVQNKSGSLSSQALQQYDSKKYIEYLDGDLFAPQDKQQISSQKSIEKAVKNSLISKKKQQILLQQLKITSIPIKLGQSALYRSESLKGLQLTLTKQDMRSKSRDGLKKSTSQKVLRKALLHIDQNSFDQYQEQINLDLLTRQFLQGSDPNSDNLDMVYSEERLKNKLAQLNRMKDSNNNDYYQQNIHQEVFQSDQDDEPLQFQNSNTLKRSQPFKLPSQQQNQRQIKIQEAEQSPKMKVQVVQDEIKSDSAQQMERDEENQKSQTIAAIIINNLILQVLKEISKSDTVAACFKNYCLSLKPKVRRAEGSKKKKGFATNKAQIQTFIDALLKFLKKEQPTVFRNLQIATGPSAIEMLKYMHQFGEQQSEVEEEEDQPNVMVIPNRMFDAFWQLKQKSIVIQVPQNYDQTNSVIFKHQFQVLKSFNKIFYRSLFDTFNECLDHQRNFGLYGKPFPWKRTPAFYHKNTDEQIQVHIQNAQRRMIELSTTYCGLIVEKEEMASISEEYIKQVHQDRLSRMLASDLIEAEQRWVFYDDEETQILVQIAGYIYTQILIQVIQEIYQFQ